MTFNLHSFPIAPHDSSLQTIMLQPVLQTKSYSLHRIDVFLCTTCIFRDVSSTISESAMRKSFSNRCSVSNQNIFTSFHFHIKKDTVHQEYLKSAMLYERNTTSLCLGNPDMKAPSKSHGKKPKHDSRIFYEFFSPVIARFYLALLEMCVQAIEAVGVSRISIKSTTPLTVTKHHTL